MHMSYPLVFLGFVKNSFFCVVDGTGLLQQLLSLKWNEPELIKVHVHYLEAVSPFLKYFPDAVGNVINKLFELLTSLPHVVKVSLFILYTCAHADI